MELQRGIFASMFQEVGNSVYAINLENGAQRGEDQLGEMGAVNHVGRESILTGISFRRKKRRL